MKIVKFECDHCKKKGEYGFIDMGNNRHMCTSCGEKYALLIEKLKDKFLGESQVDIKKRDDITVPEVPKREQI